jgi:hypothetical protein
LSRVTVDIDEDYDEFYNGSGFKTIRHRILNNVAGVWKAMIRRSSNNHVHIKVYLNQELSLFESLQLRAFLDDDPVRIACDLDRFYRTGDLDKTGRCFDEKYTKGKLRRAGKWERFT